MADPDKRKELLKRLAPNRSVTPLSIQMEEPLTTVDDLAILEEQIEKQCALLEAATAANKKDEADLLEEGLRNALLEKEELEKRIKDERKEEKLEEQGDVNPINEPE